MQLHHVLCAGWALLGASLVPHDVAHRIAIVDTRSATGVPCILAPA